ncbi:MAG TPA: response regulator [Anaerolineales bacterium]|nr:response regulator [Anaerolineales bacterium]HNQ93965.1 response regulator [Anaerolineales bacterium]HNS62713.1 response regulator [Anaerolineales bacterium]
MREIWVVDDDDEMSRAIGLMLEVLDCKVTVFNNVRGAAQLIVSGKKPDLIILDVNMPEVSGLDMLEFLRRRPDLAKLPIVMLSSEADDAVVDQALSLGADAFAMKPVTLEELERAMARAFYKHLDLRVNDE